MELTVGAHLSADVDGVEVVVVRPAAAGTAVSYRGVPLRRRGESAESAAEPAAVSDGAGLLIGKRYVDESSGLELLCVKPGPGQLTANGRVLEVKSAAQLPASD